MNLTRRRLKWLLGAALAATLTIPLAIVVACGGTSAPTATPTTPETPTPETPALDPAEIAAQKAISEAPAVAAAGAPLSERVLVSLKAVVTKLATTAKVTLPNYLAANKPSFEGENARLFFDVLAAELKQAYGLTAPTVFTSIEFLRLATALGAEEAAVFTAWRAAAQDFDGTKTAATTSWRAQVAFWNWLLDEMNNYARLQAVLTADKGLTSAALADFETVMITPKGQVSDVQDASTPSQFLVGFGGTTRIFGTAANPLPATIVPSDYLARRASELRRAVKEYEILNANPKLLDIIFDESHAQINNVFEFNLGLGYAFNIKSSTSPAIAPFWKQDAWAAFADFLAKADYNFIFRLDYSDKATIGDDSVFNLGQAVFARAGAARDILVTALRDATQTPQVEFVAETDYTLAATSPYGEDTLTAVGLAKAQPYLDTLATRPLWQALMKANADYTSKVLGMLAGLSAEQFAAFGDWLDGLDRGLNLTYSPINDKESRAQRLLTKLDRSLAVNLWDTTKFSGTPGDVEAKEHSYANFFFQLFTQQFNGPKYITPES